MNQLLRKALAYSVVLTTMTTMGTSAIYAQSTVEMTQEMAHYETQMRWEDPDKAPILKVTFTDAYKLKGKQEIFAIELNGAEWLEGQDTTLSISNAEGIQVYDAYVAADSKTKARVVVNIPKEIEEDEVISLEIPMLIFTTKEAEEVSASITETNLEEGLVNDTVIPLAISTSKQMDWQVGKLPTICDGESMASLTFTETQTGILGTRDFEVWLSMKNDALRFKAPEYESKTENSDDIAYELEPKKYLAYEGGFNAENKSLKITLTKDGKRMKVSTHGNVPSNPGIFILQNISIENRTTEMVDEPIVITLQSDQILKDHTELTVGYFKTKEVEKQPDVELEEEESIPEETPKSQITFKVGQESYQINGQSYSMSGKAYIKAPSYMMVPVRYVLEALGVTEIKVEGKKITFNYDNHIMQLTTGSREALVDGELQQLQIPLEIKEGRTYAPIGSIANLLGIEKDWEAQTQTAYFRG